MAGAVKWKIELGDEAWMGSIGYTESTSLEYVLANGASDTELPLGGITTVDVFFILSDQAITLNLDASDGTDITIDANRPAIVTGTAVTAYYGSNASGSNANLKIRLFGA